MGETVLTEAQKSLQERFEKLKDGAIKEITKKHGKGTIILGEGEFPKVDIVCSTGSIGLDNAIGIGGFPKGRIIEISGMESCGKSTLCELNIAECQRQGKICAYLDVEQAFDPTYARKLGIDVDNLILTQPETMEETFDILHSLINSKLIDYIVVDSTNSMLTKRIFDGDVGDSNMGRSALLMSQELPKVNVECSNTGCTVVFISQIRSKIGVMFGCVHPDTTVEIQSQVVSMENLFQLAGVNYNELSQNTGVDIEEKNIKIKSFNHKTNEVEFKKINRLVRKSDSEMYKLSSNNFSFMATPEHKVYTKEFGYIELKDIKENCNILLGTNDYSELVLEKLEGTYPVLDVTVEDNENYFSNNILSHNSPEKIGVGESMKFFASIRIKVKKSELVKTEEDGQESIDITANIFKNKVAPPYKSATFTLLTGKDGQYGIDTYKEIIEFAVKFELIKKGGAWFKFEHNGIDESIQGMPTLVKWFRDNEPEFLQLKQKVVDLIKEKGVTDSKPVEGTLEELKMIKEESKKAIKEKKEAIKTDADLDEVIETPTPVEEVK